MMPTIASPSIPTGTGTMPPRASSPVNRPMPASTAVVVLSTLGPLSSHPARGPRGCVHRLA